MEKGLIDSIIYIIQQVGFPVAVTIYLLWKYDKRLKEIGETLVKLTDRMKEIKTAIDNIT